MDKNLRALLYGNPSTSPSRWTNGMVTVRYVSSEDMFRWTTPKGSGQSDMTEDVMRAIKDYL